MLNDNQKKEIIQALNSKIGRQIECPICHNHTFIFVDGYLVQNLQDDMTNIVIGSGSRLPSVAMVCNKCGFMSQHNLGILDLIKKEMALNEDSK